MYTVIGRLLAPSHARRESTTSHGGRRLLHNIRLLPQRHEDIKKHENRGLRIEESNDKAFAILDLRFSILGLGGLFFSSF